MNPQAVTIGVRLGRRLGAVVVAAVQGQLDANRPSFCGGLIASVVGTIAGMIGEGTTAELLRITLAKLDQAPEPRAIELPAGVRVEPSAESVATERPTLADYRNECGVGSVIECPKCGCSISSAAPAVRHTAEATAAFNAAIDFALDEAGPEGLTFLELWREGAWPEIAEEFPTFKAPEVQCAKT